MFWENSSWKKEKWSFGSVSILWRMEIVLAWVFMNFILAWWILIVLFVIWTKPIILSKDDFTKYQNEWYIVMEKKFEWVKILNKPKNFLSDEKNFFEKWDIIKKFNWEEVLTAKKFIELQKNFLEKNDKFISYEIFRNWKENFLKIKTSEIEKNWWKLWISISSEPQIKEIKDIKLWFFDSVKYSFKECFRISVSSVKMFWEVLWKVFTEWKTPDWVSWPVWIAKATWWLVKAGDFNWVLKFMALISLSLAVVNVLPIPALDWWRFMFLLVEWIIRRPLSQKIEWIVNLFWYFFLMWLLILVTIKDVVNLF